ncbi:hypothetical protein D3227_37045 [Mesorhizobium waimense]|uniref:Uncharacterized protein n=1 Tax=Mesorhizobium waimense TaxID=1300307 RepID=A0A3A5JUJ8_9HYPH|nr:hypothetical protein D3227_37045 [Mesorhizobium waimense]
MRRRDLMPRPYPQRDRNEERVQGSWHLSHGWLLLALQDMLLAELNRQLEGVAFLVKRGTLVDATIISGAVCHA